MAGGERETRQWSLERLNSLWGIIGGVAGLVTLVVAVAWPFFSLRSDVTRLEEELDRLRVELRSPLGFVGSVVAFTQGTGCPDGWTSWEDGEGRFVLGAGDENRILQLGGEEEVRLTIDHIPSHSHDISHEGTEIAIWLPADRTDLGSRLLVWNHGSLSFGEPATDIVLRPAGGVQFDTDLAFAVSSTGAGDRHNNMPPYIALYWCTPITEGTG